MRLLEPNAQIWMKIDPYYQRQKCRPMILSFWKYKVHADIRGGPLGGGVKWEWGCRQRQFLAISMADSSATSELSPTWRYAAPCRPVVDCKMKDLEWPWMAIGRQNPFSASTLLQNRCVSWSALHKFERRYWLEVSCRVPWAGDESSGSLGLAAATGEVQIGSRPNRKSTYLGSSGTISYHSEFTKTIE